MGSIGWTEILVIALIAVDRFAQAPAGVGEAIRNFRDGMRGDSESGKSNSSDDADRKSHDR